MFTNFRSYGCRIISNGAKRTYAWKMKQSSKKKAAADEKSLSELKPWPSYIQDRILLWDKLKAEYDNALAAKESINIIVTLPDGKEIPAQSWRTTPYDVAKVLIFLVKLWKEFMEAAYAMVHQ
ncbi:hypothetical protein KM043_015722 [Ampulex compressa]|nr:hypothetical protein KM043_015722 [Ampulex compressa]